MPRSPRPPLRAVLAHAAEHSFNAITVDGDTSTNDAFMLIASGQAGNREIVAESDSDFGVLRDAVADLAAELAQAIIRDGEGATKFITVRVEQGATREECRKVAFAIAHSPLVKTAFFASDPNLGRILAAIGYAGIDDLDVLRLQLFLDDVRVASGGGRDPAYRERTASGSCGERDHRARGVGSRLSLGDRVDVRSVARLCHINAEYRT